MDASTTHAWILLSIPSPGAAINEIRWRAAAINKVEPTELELQQSLRWLTAAGLISVDSELYSPTSAGRRLVEEEWQPQSMIDTWRCIGLRLAKAT